MRKIMTAALVGAALAGAAGAAIAQPAVVVEERWGHWDPAWGVAPPAPPRVWNHYWRHHEDRWYGHVHNCMVRFTTYDPRRDMYRVHRRWVRCRD